jgi:hypothetical protein
MPKAAGAVVADQPAREADQDRRQGRQPRSLRHLPNGGGRSVASDVPGNPVADRPAAGTARATMRSAGGQIHREPRQRYALIKAKLRVPAAARPAILGFRSPGHPPLQRPSFRLSAPQNWQDILAWLHYTRRKALAKRASARGKGCGAHDRACRDRVGPGWSRLRRTTPGKTSSSRTNAALVSLCQWRKE